MPRTECLYYWGLFSYWESYALNGFLNELGSSKELGPYLFNDCGDGDGETYDTFYLVGDLFCWDDPSKSSS